MRFLYAVLLVSTLSIAGCSGGSSTQTTGVVLAQSGYSNASLSGTYAFQIVSPYNGGGPFYDEIGTITFDGNGKIISGSGAAYLALTTASCTYSNFTGTYSIQSSGTGSGTLSNTTSGSGCGNGFSGLPISFAVAGSGATVEFASASSTAIFAGSAAKQ
jgi:hypothetical protein